MMEVYIFIGICAFLVLGVISEVVKSSNKRKMEDLLSGRGGGFDAAYAHVSNESINKIEESRVRIDENNTLFEKLTAEYESGKIPFLEYNDSVEKLLQSNADLRAGINVKPPIIGGSNQFAGAVGAGISNGGADDFIPSKKYLSGGRSTGIALDSVRKKIAILTTYSKEIISADQIVGVEICIDSETMISTDRASLVGGAIVGGLLTGGVGALVFAMGAKKKQEQNINNVELKILVAGSKSPIYRISFFGPGDTYPKGAISEVADWHDTIMVLMKEVEICDAKNASKSHQIGNQSVGSSSVADEIKKLNELLCDGIISQDEFVRAKSKLI